jgi:hypothetical protein
MLWAGDERFAATDTRPRTACRREPAPDCAAPAVYGPLALLRRAVSQQSAPHAANPATESGATALSLGADEQVSISPEGRATPVRRVQSEAEVGWASGQLVFENETIAEIARRFNLYNRTQVQVLDTVLATQRISGMFRASDPQSFVAFVRVVTGATVAQPDFEHITLGSPQQNNGGAAQ